jgi:dipeptidyl aminopeptidase/acylaminoacyl peptidase
MLHLWVVSMDGSNLRRLATNPLAKVDEEPAWSPDGQKIAFSSSTGGTSDIWTISPNGSGLTRLTSNALNSHQPAWAPDGSKIAYVSDRGGSNDIWIMNANGSGARRLTTLGGQENHPSFSPDGASIVFSESQNGTATLMAINVDGSNLHAITTGTTFADWNPSWGTQGIVFSSNRDTTSEHWKIWIVQPDGTGLGRLGDVIALDPVWTRDGHLLFTDATCDCDSLSAPSVLDPVTGTKRRISLMNAYPVAIDIRPGKPNNINPKGTGDVPVAILSAKGFDATTAVDQATLHFGRTGSETSLDNCQTRKTDVNHDGLYDLVCNFVIPKAAFQRGDKLGILRFNDVNGVPYEGSDKVITTKDDGD